MRGEKSLDILIPSRNEMFLSRTIEDILKNMRGDTKIIAVLDGCWADPPVKDHPNVILLHYSEAIGQRAATNAAARISDAKYLMKMDAHCAVAEGFDEVLMTDIQPDWCCTPIMRNLHAFNWVCKKCGDTRYQGPTPIACNNKACDNKIEFVRDVVWIAKTNPQSTSYCFDSEPHFQYFTDFKKRPDYKGKDFTESMSLQGSCFMLTRDKYFELNICDESFGSWGSQGIEVAVKTWLSGGKVICNHKTWYAHMFRTQGGDFGFPWPASGRKIQQAKLTAKDVFFNNKWEKQKYPLSWLVEKFWPVPGWTKGQLEDLKKGNVGAFADFETLIAPHEEDKPSEDVPLTQEEMSKLTKGIVYYTDNRIEPELAKKVQEALLQTGLPIVSVSLQPIDFGENIVLNKERSYLTMFEQILEGIERNKADILFLCEHDVLYTPEHFQFTPLNKDQFFYNMHNWQVRQHDGHAVYWEAKKVSQVCAYRELLLTHYRERVRRVRLEGFTRRMGFEPGTHRRPERVDNTTSQEFRTDIANLDIRHKYNLTHSRWSPTQFRNPCRNWTESHVNKLKGWEDLKL